MSGTRTTSGYIFLAVASLLGSVLLLNCQPTQPVATPRPAEKAAVAAPTKAPEKAAEKPVRGGTLRLSTPGEFGSLDANTQTGMSGFYSPYEQLVEPDKDVNLTKEGLSTDWTVSGDGKTITFKLRPGVKFHDGTDFNAAAVKFNMDRMMDPATKSPFRSYYEFVASVEVVDNLTVRLNFRQPDTLLLPQLAGGAGGLMVSPAAVKKYGADLARNPVGTGPFQFVEWKAADHVTFKRFDGYWKKDKDGNQLPYLDQVIYQFIADETTAVANLRAGQVDLIANQAGVSAGQATLVMNDPNITYQMRPNPNISGINMNTKRAPFDNKAVRQAVALALDREGMAGLYGGRAMVWPSLFSPVAKDYDDGKAGTFPARDVAKAKAKMAEAGYPSGGLKAKYSSGSGGDAIRNAEVVKANLAEIGVEVEIEALGSAALQTKIRIEQGHQMGGGSTGIPVGDPGQYLYHYLHSKGGRNYHGPYSNPQVDAALDKARTSVDLRQRAAFYQEAAKLVVGDAPTVPLYGVAQLAGMSKKVRNYVIYWDLFERTRDVWLAQ